MGFRNKYIYMYKLLNKLIIFFCLFNCIYSKGGAGGYSRGSSGMGSSRNNVNYKSHLSTINAAYVYYAIQVRSHRYAYLNNEDFVKQHNDSLQLELFTCKNKKLILKDDICNHINDCGDASDELSPLICKGHCTKNEMSWYITSFILSTMIFIILILLRKVNWFKKEVNNDNNYSQQNELTIFFLITQAILAFIGFIFILTCSLNNITCLFEYWVTMMFFNSLFTIWSCMLVKKRGLILTFGHLLIYVIMYNIGMETFYSYPNNLINKLRLNESNLIYPEEFNKTNNSIDLILDMSEKSWIDINNQDNSFTIDFGRNEKLSHLVIWPTFPKQTTRKFKIFLGTNLSNMTIVASGVFPQLKESTSMDLIISENGYNSRFLSFQGDEMKKKNNESSNSSINSLNKTFVNGLKEIEIYSFIHLNI